MSTLERKFLRHSRTYVFPWKWGWYAASVILCNRKHGITASIPILN